MQVVSSAVKSYLTAEMVSRACRLLTPRLKYHSTQPQLSLKNPTVFSQLVKNIIVSAGGIGGIGAMVVAWKEYWSYFGPALPEDLKGKILQSTYPERVSCHRVQR